MTKKTKKIVVAVSAIAVTIAIICMIWLIGVCFTFLKEYRKNKQLDTPVMTEEKKALTEMLEGYDALSLDSFYYDNDKECYCISCKCSEADINDEIYDEGISFFTDVIEWAYAQNNELKDSKIEIMICDDRTYHSVGQFLELKNFTFSKTDERFVPDKCISAYIGENGSCNYSDTEEFAKKYPNVGFVW